MTAYLVDISRYQVERPDPIDLAKAKAAGYTLVNIALTGGRGYVSGAWAKTYTDRARQLGMGVSFYHWLDGRTPGASQAIEQVARMRSLFGASTGFAHVVDVEESGANGITAPTWQHVVDYVRTAQAMLGRPIAIYTGDWYWKPRGWAGAPLTGLLHAAPDVGYLAAYPGDQSSAWSAGWGGWEDRAIMQWGVRPLPGTGDCSLSAIREPAVWTAMTGVTMSFAPQSLLDARAVFRAETDLQPVELGIVGDAAHADGGDSYHLGKDQLKSNASYSKTESSRDRNPTNAASALDIGKFTVTYNGTTHTLRSFSRWLVAECEANAPDTLWIREVIYSPDGSTVDRWDRLGRRSTGDSSHLMHTHVSGFRDSENADRAAIFRRYFTTIKGTLMALTNADADVVWKRDIIPNPKQRGDSPTNPTTTAFFATGDIWQQVYNLRDAVSSLQSGLNAIGKGLSDLTAKVEAAGLAATVARNAITQHEAADLDRNQAAVGGILQALHEVRGQISQLAGAGADPVTVAELETAFRNVLRDGTGTAS